jgi:hypothetical protein
MDDENQFEEMLKDIDQILVKVDELNLITREREHFAIAFDLLRECGQYSQVLSLVSTDGPTWNIVQAVYGGHLVRAYKLLNAILDMCIKNRSEIITILIRAEFECIVNLRYLMKNYSPELIDSYIKHSFQQEKDLIELMRSKIELRGGVEIPIEARMTSSIQRALDNSCISMDDMPAKKIRNWGDVNIFEKAKSVDLRDAYGAIFGGLSRNVHGEWYDLLQHHLEPISPGEFKPDLEFTPITPQPLYALTYLLSDTFLMYCNHLGHPEFLPLIDRLEKLIESNDIANGAHENFLIRKYEPGK